MSLLTRIFRSLFQRYPKYEVSAYHSLYSALVTCLTREGVKVGGTAKYPRVEIHSIRESERLDKEGAIRSIYLTVESISNSSLAEAVQMNDDNLRLMTQDALSIEDWDCMGVIPVQLQDMTESSDSNKIIYRILQEVNIFLELIKSDTPPPEPEPTPTPEPEEPVTEETAPEAENEDDNN